jgi:6-methylsalicylate decarboxylase
MGDQTAGAIPEAPLIDVHAHFLTESYVAAARGAGHDHPDGMPGWPTWWSPSAFLDLMDTAGISTAVLSCSSPGTHFGDDQAARLLTREVNEYGAGLVRDHPGRFGHFATLPLPDVDGSLAELTYALDALDADGVAVKTNAHGRYLGDPGFEPVWRELDRRGAVVFVHPTSPPQAEATSAGLPRPAIEFIFDSARAAFNLVIAGVLHRYPRVQWIFPHGGGALPLLADRVELFRAGLGVGLGPGDGPKVPEQLARLWFDLAGTPFPRQVPALASAFGTGHILYGSDYCWTPAPAVRAQIASIDAAPQPEGTTWRALTTSNARRLLPKLG